MICKRCFMRKFSFHKNIQTLLLLSELFKFQELQLSELMYQSTAVKRLTWNYYRSIPYIF